MADKNGKSEVAARILKQLKDPFDPKLVKFRPGGGKSLAYIDARDVMKRLDDVMGPENWQDDYVDVVGGKVCILNLRIEGEWIHKSNGANDTKVESVKGGLSNALKRAAVNWGVGRYLYYLPSWCNAGNVDQWPKWALPGSDVVNWEDIAELEAGTDTGMDQEEVAVATINLIEKINAAKTKEELKEVVKDLDADTQRIFADAIANKTEELLGGTSK
jgi:hypothetical protein